MPLLERQPCAKGQESDEHRKTAVPIVPTVPIVKRDGISTCSTNIDPGRNDVRGRLSPSRQPRDSTYPIQRPPGGRKLEFLRHEVFAWLVETRYRSVRYGLQDLGGAEAAFSVNSNTFTDRLTPFITRSSTGCQST